MCHACGAEFVHFPDDLIRRRKAEESCPFATRAVADEYHRGVVFEVWGVGAERFQNVGNILLLSGKPHPAFAGTELTGIVFHPRRRVSQGIHADRDHYDIVTEPIAQLVLDLAENCRQHRTALRYIRYCRIVQQVIALLMKKKYLISLMDYYLTQ